MWAIFRLFHHILLAHEDFLLILQPAFVWLLTAFDDVKRICRHYQPGG